MAQLSKFNWLTDLLTPLAVILMESLCIYPWLVFLGKWPLLTENRDILSLPSVLVLIGGTYLVTKFFRSRKQAMPLARTGIVLAAVIIIFAVIRLEYNDGFPLFSGGWFVSYARMMLDIFAHLHPVALAIPFAFFLCWRGISRGQHAMYFYNIYPSFLIGMAALVLLVIIWSFSTGSSAVVDLTAKVGVYIAGFFFCGLTALALANLQNIGARLKKKEGAPETFNRRWLGIVLGIISGTVLLGAGFAGAFSSQFIGFLSKAAGFIWSLIEQAAYYIFLPIGYLVGWLYTFFMWLIELIRNKQAALPTENAGEAQLENLPETITKSLSPELLLILKWGFFILILTLLIFWLVKAILRNRAASKDEDIAEEHESLWSWRGFRDDFKQWLESIRQRFTLPEKPATAATVDWDKEAGVKLSIRQIYERLLWYMARLNTPRRPQETPYEYAHRIKQILQDQQPPVTGITEHYVNNRYGNTAVNEQNVADANTLWDNLRPTLSQMVSEQNSKHPPR